MIKEMDVLKCVGSRTRGYVCEKSSKKGGCVLIYQHSEYLKSNSPIWFIDLIDE